MKVVFNGTVIASEFSDGGTDTVQGFTVDEAEQLVQQVTPLRAPDMVVFPRGNRKRTMTGSVLPQASPTLDAAMTARATLYDALPVSGTLVTVQGANAVTWATAILQKYRKLELKGVSYGFTLTFIPIGPGVPSTLTTVLGTGSGGAILGDGRGGELGTGI